MKQVIERVQSPTPKFFKKLRNIGLVLATVATTVVAMVIAVAMTTNRAAKVLQPCCQ